MDKGPDFIFPSNWLCYACDILSSITERSQVANIIFLDAPVGTGYSYAKTWEGYSNMSDTLSAAEIYEFFRKVS